MWTLSYTAVSSVLYGERLGLMLDYIDPEAQHFIDCITLMFKTTSPMLYIPPGLLRQIGAKVWRDHVEAWDGIFNQGRPQKNQDVRFKYCFDWLWSASWGYLEVSFFIVCTEYDAVSYFVYIVISADRCIHNIYRQLRQETGTPKKYPGVLASLLMLDKLSIEDIKASITELMAGGVDTVRKKVTKIIYFQDIPFFPSCLKTA